MTTSDAPSLVGIPYLKLPVTNLTRSLEWYRGRLGYDTLLRTVPCPVPARDRHRLRGARRAAAYATRPRQRVMTTRPALLCTA
jgi:hypothetical protein